MKNDKFFNWFMIIVPLLVSIGMFKHGIDYFWLPYIVSLITLARYTDFLEAREKDKEAVPFPIKHRKRNDKYLWQHISDLRPFNEDEVWKANCTDCGYVICVCNPICK